MKETPGVEECAGGIYLISVQSVHIDLREGDKSGVVVCFARDWSWLFCVYELASGRGMLQFEAAGEPKQIWVVPGGEHGSNYIVAREEYARRVLAFFDAALFGGE